MFNNCPKGVSKRALGTLSALIARRITATMKSRLIAEMAHRSMMGPLAELAELGDALGQGLFVSFELVDSLSGFE